MQRYLSLGQRNTLTVIVQHIFHFDCHWRDAENSVTPVNDFPFAGNKYIFALGKEYFLGLSGLAGESEEFQIDRWRWWRAGWLRRRLGLICRAVFNGARQVYLSP